MRWSKPPKPTVDRATAAELLGVTVRTISRYQSRGLVRFKSRGGKTQLLLEDVQQLQQTPAASMLRVESKRLRMMSARVAMLEHQLADVMDALDAKLYSP